MGCGLILLHLFGFGDRFEPFYKSDMHQKIILILAIELG